MGLYIDECLNSCLKQTYKNLEIIAINDGSTDKYSKDKFEKMKKQFEGNVLFIEQQNQGLSATRNNGIDVSKGSYVCCLDADDYIAPEFTEKLVKVLESNPKVGIVSPWVSVFGDSNYIWKTEIMTTSGALSNNSLCVTSLFRKECWQIVGGYDQKMKNGYEDWDFWISIIGKGYSSRVIEEPLHFYRDRSNSLLKSSDQKRLEIMNYLINKHSNLALKHHKEIILCNEKELVWHRNNARALEKQMTMLENALNPLQKQALQMNELVDKNELLEKEISEIKNGFSYKLLIILRTRILDKILVNRSGVKKNIKNTFKILRRIYRFFKSIASFFRIDITIPMTQKEFSAANPLVSVIIPNYNYGQYIREAIESVVNQTFKDFEIIIIDSASTDDSKTVIENIKDSRVQCYFRKTKNLVGNNRNFGISKARGKYICCLDADDVLDSTYLEKAVFLLETQNFDVVSTSIQCFGLSNQAYYQIEKPCLADMVKANHISTVAVFKKSLFNQVGGFYDWGLGEKHVPEDWDLWVRMSIVGARFYNIHEALMQYRIHGSSSLSNDSECNSRESQRVQIVERNRTKLTRFAYFKSSLNKRILFDVSNPYINLDHIPVQTDVLFVLPYTVLGGADTIFVHLFNQLIENKIDTAVITTNTIDELQHDTTNIYRQFSNEIFHMPRFLSNKKWYQLFISYFIKSRGIKSIFQGGSQYFYDCLPLIKKEFPLIKIIDIQFNTDVHFTNNLKYSKHIDTIIAENQQVFDKFTKEYGVKRTNISLIPFAVDANVFDPDRTKSLSQPSYIENGKFVISYLGRLSPEKNPEFMIKLAEKFRSNQDIQFIIAGPGNLSHKLQEMIDRRKLDNIRLIGSIDTIDLLAFTKIVIVPSIIDGNPIVIKESLSMGIPVVASNIGGIPYIISNGVNGFICEVNNIDQFKSSIEKIYKSKELQRLFKTNCRQYALDHFDVKKTNEKYLEIFKDSLS
jgi:glycosyltransferase involved in cell wall biosynthesis